MYTDYARQYGIERVLVMVLPAGPGPATGPGRTVRLEFTRTGRCAPDFSERTARCWPCCAPTCTRPISTLNGAAHGTPRLTPRQRELLQLVAAGHTNAQIARRLGVSDGTVRIHLQNIYARLQVPSRTAAVTRAFPDLAAG
jgi:DNA-binding CsgD family transcriptional regulator